MDERVAWELVTIETGCLPHEESAHCFILYMLEIYHTEELF